MYASGFNDSLSRPGGANAQGSLQKGLQMTNSMSCCEVRQWSFGDQFGACLLQIFGRKYATEHPPRNDSLLHSKEAQIPSKSFCLQPRVHNKCLSKEQVCTLTLANFYPEGILKTWGGGMCTIWDLGKLITSPCLTSHPLKAILGCGGRGCMSSISTFQQAFKGIAKRSSYKATNRETPFLQKSPFGSSTNEKMFSQNLLETFLRVSLPKTAIETLKLVTDTLKATSQTLQIAA